MAERMIDLDAFEERAAIMEFDGGMTRFEAETAAAKAQGFSRWEVMNHAKRARDIAAARDKREPIQRDRQGDMPRMQSASEKQD